VSIGGGTDDTQFPQQTAALGNHNDGSIAVRLPGVGPFDSIDGVSSDAVLVYVVANAGHSSGEDTARDTLNMISRISAAVATAVMTIVFGAAEVWAGISLAVDQLMEYFHNELFADCDTITAFGIETRTSQQLYDDTYDPLDQRTESAPFEEEFDKKKGDKLLDMFGGGCQDSKYRVRWKVVRHRQPDEVLSLHTEPGFLQPIRLGYDAGTRLPFVAPSNVVVQWTDAGGVPNRVDQLGNVRTPLTPSPSTVRTEYVVARARGLVDGNERYWGVAFILFGDAAG
jgi:hypothetical protein